LRATGTSALGLDRSRDLCQFLVCHRVRALPHRALTEPAQKIYRYFLTTDKCIIYLSVKKYIKWINIYQLKNMCVI